MHHQTATTLNTATVYKEQTHLLYSSMLSALIANIFASTLLVFAQWSVIDHNLLLSWLAFSVSVIFLRLILLFSFKRAQNRNSNIHLWGRLFDLGSTTSALVLGVAGVLLFPQHDQLHQILTAFVLVGMSAGAVSTLSIGKYSFPLYISFALIPIIVSFFSQQTQFSLVMSASVILAYIYILKSSRTLHHYTTQNIELRIEANIREQELLNTQQKQILHLKNTPLAIIEWSTDFKVVEWNPSAERIFGYSRDKAIGAYGPDLIIPDSAKPLVQGVWDNLISQTGSTDLTNQNITADGKLITCEWHNTPLINQRNEVIGVASTAQDISVRIQAESELIETKNMLQLVLNTIPARVFWKDTNNNYLGCNEQFANDAGLVTSADIIGHNDFEMPWKTHAHLYQEDDNFVMQNDKPRIAYEENLTLNDGSTNWIETSKIPLKDIHGNIYGVLGTYHDITERKLAISEILHAKEVAEKANNAKSEFLSRMSHELRTPLNAILGFGQLIQISDNGLKNTHKEGINQIVNAGTHLLDLINEILDISRIDAGQMNLNIETIDLISVLSEVIVLVSPLTAVKNITVTLIPSAENITLDTDKTRLKQVFINIITNAIKYNRIDGEVSIEVSSKGNTHYTVSIKDTGVGIKKEDQALLFEPFTRFNETSFSNEGTGIGLTVTKKLIDLLHAKIQFTSSYGEGTEFIVELPASIQ